MHVVWLKRDVRLHDHGPLHYVISSSENSKNSNCNPVPICLLYLYEPEQLMESTVHGSHIALINEGLIDLDQQLSSLASTAAATTTTVFTSVQKEYPSRIITASSKPSFEFQYLTVCYGNAIPVLQEIHDKYTLQRLVAHEETGNYASYQRDRQVREWCKKHSIPFIEFQQGGVTRRLHNRDDFAKNLKIYMNQPQFLSLLDNNSSNNDLLKKRLIPRIQQLDLNGSSSSSSSAAGLNVEGISDRIKHQVITTKVPLLEQLEEIPLEHRVDRPYRQRGGERAALKTLQSFLEQRCEGYSTGISSPLSSWTSCSRLSVFLSWGHLSIRHAYHATKQRQEQLKRQSGTGTWCKSLAAFQSRLHWRSHFIQKLESDPLLEKRDMNPSYQQLRRQPNDWNESYYEAWATGTTGYPFVDACMRCLIQTGWINFRMRAMLVSFATYNLWLDWKRIAPHLARLFADYEPGIHYPQLQMQAGTTGINAMRVYNVVKQGKDQDPDGIFVKRYIQAMRHVAKEYVHTPWNLSRALQEKYKVRITARISTTDGGQRHGDSTCNEAEDNTDVISYYPERIVDAEEAARVAKAKIHAVRQLGSTKQIAKVVYDKLGSRSVSRDTAITKRDRTITAKKSTTETTTPYQGQSTIRQFLTKPSCTSSAAAAASDKYTLSGTTGTKKRKERNETVINPSESELFKFQKTTTSNNNITGGTWACHACTYANDKPFGLVCEVCGSKKSKFTTSNRG